MSNRPYRTVGSQTQDVDKVLFLTAVGGLTSKIVFTISSHSQYRHMLNSPAPAQEGSSLETMILLYNATKIKKRLLSLVASFFSALLILTLSNNKN